MRQQELALLSTSIDYWITGVITAPEPLSHDMREQIRVAIETVVRDQDESLIAVVTIRPGALS